MTCKLGTIAGGGSAQILVTAHVASSAAGQTITNCASATRGQHRSGTARSCASIHVPPGSTLPQPASDLQIIKHVNHGKA